MWREKGDEGCDHEAHNEGDRSAFKTPHATSGLDPDDGGRRIEAEEGDPGGNQSPERSAVPSLFGHALRVSL